MEYLVHKYEDKLIKQGLAKKETILIGGLNATLVWNNPAHFYCNLLEEIFQGLSINSLVYAQPEEPYFSIMNYLAEQALQRNEQAIYPKDCETRTFMHELPVATSFDAKTIIEILCKRKSVFILNHGIVTYGVVSPEQAFIYYSSVCFAGYVAFYTEYYQQLVVGQNISNQQRTIFDQGIRAYSSFLESLKNPSVQRNGPFTTSGQVIEAIQEAGEKTVECRMVDSFFGNISYHFNDTIFISETSSSLDELVGCIDQCPMDGSSCAGLTASSEFLAHKNVYLLTSNKAILHGHPKFSVIMSMMCEHQNCESKGQCHIKCPYSRFIEDIPIVTGEVGTGPRGLYHTLPKALEGARGTIVYGHGLFTTGKEDFSDAFQNLMDIEIMCLDTYKKKSIS